MKKKNELKKKSIKLDLEKIEIDELSKSMLNGIQGGYVTQPPCNPTVGTCGTHCACQSDIGWCTDAGQICSSNVWC